MIKVKISHVSDLLDSKLDFELRGIVITCLLLRDKTDKLTYAKIKSEISINKYREQLLKLHELSFIEWSQYEKQKEKVKDKELDPAVVDVITFMNKLYKRGFDPKSESTTKNLINRLKEHDIDVIKKVIANRYQVWKDDPVMKKYLQPQTIFRPSKFDKYLEELKSTGVGESIVVMKDIGIEYGDELTIDIIDNIIAKEVYCITTYKLTPRGSKLGVGVLDKLYGKDLQRILKLQNNKISRGGTKEYCYIYTKNE